jgi:hypothetical protein
MRSDVSGRTSFLNDDQELVRSFCWNCGEAKLAAGGGGAKLGAGGADAVFCGAYRPEGAGFGLDVTGSSAKKSLEGALDRLVGF